MLSFLFIVIQVFLLLPFTGATARDESLSTFNYQLQRQDAVDTQLQWQDAVDTQLQWQDAVDTQLQRQDAVEAFDEQRQRQDAVDTIRLIFAGDVMGHEAQLEGAWRDGSDSCYHFSPTFQWVKDFISSADLAVANLEVTFAGKPYTGYPTFSSPASLAVALKDAGFNLLMTANNHILDRGAQGLEQTLNTLENLDILYTGTFRDADDRKINYPLIINKNGFTLAFLNYTYGSNRTITKSPVIVNYLDTVQLAVDLAKCREMKPDFIIACVHWGDEYKTIENQTQQQLADFLARNGCNLIVGSHPHVVQPIKKIAVPATDSVLVAYSLGNFISNQRQRYSDGGVLLEVTLTKTNGHITLDSYRIEPVWVYRFPDKGVQLYRLIPVIDFLSNPDRYPEMSLEDEKLLIQFFIDTKKIKNY